MARRSCSGRTVGFYKVLVNGEELERGDDNEKCLEVKDGSVLEDGVFLVERVVERRTVKVYIYIYIIIYIYMSNDYDYE